MKKYKRALILAGGGNRFAVYAAMYSALVEHKLAPDLILGSCGASLSSAIISHLVEPQRIKEYLKSKEFYSLVKNIKLTEQKKIFKLPFYLLSNALLARRKIYTQDIIKKFLIDFPTEIEKFLVNLAKEKPKIDSIIIASKLDFENSNFYKTMNKQKIYKELILTNIKEDIELQTIFRTKAYQNSLIDNKIEIIKEFSLLKASRISMSDMFLISPVLYKDNYLFGGAVDLLPIEIANSLAEDIFLELKQSYTLIENSVLKNVLAYDGNARFKDVLSLNASHWIDSSDIPKYFKKYYNLFSFNFFKMELQLNIPTYEQYCEDVDLQWNYGYSRVLESLKLEKNFKKHQRIKIK